MEPPAPVVYGKYQLLELLARGGMAEVYKAKSHGVEGFEKILVIKRILGELGANPRFVEMFINEAKIAVTLSHANIVQVFDLGQADSNYFIAMEYVAGADLATVLRRARKYDNPLTPELAVFIVSEVAKGLDYAHRRRDAELQPLHIVHRDVSPQNILLSYEGEVKLTDFGIAKARTTVEQSTEHGVLKGKYAYMAPEQASAAHVDGRTDIYALGTVLYEALAGHNPVLRPTSYETLQVVREGTIEPLEVAAPELPEELRAIVGRAMHHDPAERHANAGLFYEELVQFLYASGRRVGAHDLANYLDQIRASSLRGRPFRAESDEDLRIAFEMETSPGRAATPERTPAKVPSARSEAEHSTGSGARALSGVPREERRDLSCIAYQILGEADAVAEGRAWADTAIRRAGGTIVRKGEADPSFAVFGLHQPDGRDTEAAARVALSIHAMVLGGADAKTAVHAGRGTLGPDGLQEDEPAFQDLLVAAQDELEGASAVHPRATGAARLVLRRHFDLREEGRGWVLLGERNLTETSGRFVGRRDELRQVGEVLSLASKGEQSLLEIVGESGVGKSRLLRETMRRLRRGDQDAGIYVCKMPAQSRDIPLSGCQEMLRVILGVDEFDRETQIREKTQRLRELGLPKAELDAVSLTLGVGSEEALPGPRALRAALARIALKLAEDRLTVFVFDDFDEVDPASIELLRALVSGPGEGRIVILVAHREDSDPGLVDEDHPGHHRLRLESLPDEDIARLVASRLGVDDVPPALLHEVSAKSAGNPLYVEEYLLALQDAGAVRFASGELRFEAGAAIEVPKSLRGIVAARLARLPLVQRHFLQIASVIGGRFHDAMVEAVSDEAPSAVVQGLERLVERGILLRTGPQEYGFVHGLIPDVVYTQLPYEARRELHGAVGTAFERVYPAHLDELAERLAHHHREGGQRDRALDFLVQAADRLEQENALPGAVTNLERAIELMGQLPSPDRDRLLTLLWRIAELCFRCRDLDVGARRVEQALELADGLGRDEHVARFSMLKGRFWTHQNRFDEARPWFERARQVARRVGKSALLREISVEEADSLARNGEYQAAIRSLREALTLSREAHDRASEIRCLVPLALAYGGSGDQEAGNDALAEARRLAGTEPEVRLECDLRKCESLVAYFTGDLSRAAEAASGALELAKEFAFSYEAAVNAHNLGEIYLRLGDFKRAFVNLRYSYDVSREHGYERLAYTNMRVLGFIDAAKLGSPEGRARIQAAAEYAERNGMIWDLIQSRYLLAIVDHQRGATDLGREGFRDVLRLAAEHGQRHYEHAAEKALGAIDAGQPVSMPQ